MAVIVVKPVTSSRVWEGFIARHAEANFLQSWLWGDFYERLGKAVYRSGFYQKGQLVGIMLSVVEPARRGHYIAVSGGPIIDWQSRAVRNAAVREMRRIGKLERCAFVRVRPQLHQTEQHAALFAQAGFRPAQMHMHAELTLQLDLTKPLEELWGNLRKGTRYELKQAEKQGVKVSATTNVAAINEFFELQLLTAKRHGFVSYGKVFLTEQFRVFAGADKALLYSAHTADGRLIAQAFVIFYGQEAVYHYGASTELARTVPGAYLLQWTAIQEAKRRNLHYYNFWGVVKPGQTKHRFYGVSVFKRGFRGADVEYLHAHDLVLNWPRYVPNLVVEAIRKRRRRL